MNRPFTRLLLVFHFLLVGLVIGACRMNSHGMSITEQNEAQTQMSTQIDTLLRTSNINDRIYLTDHTPFEWDRLCVFFEGFAAEQINQELGFAWASANQQLFSRQHVVFALEQTVTMHVPLAVERFYLDSGDVNCIARSEAIFQVQGQSEIINNEVRRYFVREK